MCDKFFAFESRSARHWEKLSPYRPSAHVFHLRLHLHNISNNCGPDPEEDKAITLKYVLKNWAERMGDGLR